MLAAYTDRTRRGDGISLFIVDADTPGYTVERKLKKTGHHTSETAALAFRTCGSRPPRCSAASKAASSR
jgi:acyl-CoA dehydrogenase